MRFPLAGPSTDSGDHDVTNSGGCFARSQYGVHNAIPSHKCGRPEATDFGLCDWHLQKFHDDGMTPACKGGPTWQR